MRPRELRPLLRSFVPLSVVMALALTVAVGLAAPALAHADFVSSDPADGSVLQDAPSQIEVVFSDSVEPTGPGLRVLDSTRESVEVTVFQPSNEVIAAVFEDPLADGRYVVFFSARSDDGHDVDGSFSFEVGAAAPQVTTTLATSTSTVAPVNAPSEDAGGPGAGWDLLAFIGRWLAIAGAVLAVGAFAFASASLIGTESEVRRSVGWIRRGGVLVIVGTLIEVASLALVDGAFPGALAPDAVFTTVATSHLVAAVLRIIGGVALLQSPSIAMLAPFPRTDPVRYRLAGREEWLTVAGLVTVLASFAFDGHRSAGGAVGRIAAVVHVGAAGVWVGGVWTMLDVVIRRRRTRETTDTARMAIRFSRIAAGALVAILVAGVALAISIADGWSDLFDGAWGRVLIAKVIVVATAAAIGGYNHFRVVPSLAGSDQGMHDQLRHMLIAESALFAAVTILTAILVAASI